MRKRFNPNAICSSDNYNGSKKAHRAFISERHSHFTGIAVSGKITILQKSKVITVFGKDIRITIEEYNEHCAHLGF